MRQRLPSIRTAQLEFTAPHRWAGLLCLLLVLVLPTAAWAQANDTSVTARLSQRQAYVGEFLEYQIVVVNGQPDSPPAVNWPDGLSGNYAGENSLSQQRTVRDPATGRGRLVTTTTRLYTYRFTPSQTGEYILPPVRVRVAGRDYETEPLSLTIIEPPESEDSEVIVQLDRTSVYIGETLRVQCRWYLTSSVSEYSFRPSSKPESLEAFSLDDGSRASRREQLYPIDIFGVRTVGRLSDATYRGQRTRVLTFEVLLRPTEAGEFELGPIAVLFDRRTNRGTNARTIARSEPLAITVQAPPLDGQPVGFTGLMGRYGLAVEASPTRAYVGEPIDVTVRISGQEPMSRVRTGPELESIPGLTDDFRLSPDGWEREPSRDGERIFSTKLRALSGEVTEIPALRLPYFDPEAGAYRIAATEPIPLEIESVRTTTLADAVGLENTEPEQARIAPAGPVVWAEDRGSSLLRREPATWGAMIRSPVWIAAATLPPAAYAIVFLLARWRAQHDPELARCLAALQAARKTAQSGELAQAARQALVAALQIEPDAVTSQDADRLPVGLGVIEVLAAALETEEAAFAEASIPPPTPSSASEVAAAIQALHEAIRSRGSVAAPLRQEVA